MNKLCELVKTAFPLVRVPYAGIAQADKKREGIRKCSRASLAKQKTIGGYSLQKTFGNLAVAEHAFQTLILINGRPLSRRRFSSVQPHGPLSYLFDLLAFLH